MMQQTKLPWATIANIILAHEKNKFYAQKLRLQLNDLLLDAFGQLFPQKHKREISMISNGIYYSAFAISGMPTLGDQYADILPFSGKEFPPPWWRRLLFLVNHAFGKFIIVIILRSLKQIHYKKYLDDNSIPLLHNALFYFDSCYYYISYRVAGIKFKLMRKERTSEKDTGYAILGILSLIQLMIRLGVSPVIESAREEENTDTNFKESESCMLCLSVRKKTVSTPCGHLFCWYCIADWITKKPECPLCRNYVAPPQLIPVHSFQ